MTVFIITRPITGLPKTIFGLRPTKDSPNGFLLNKMILYIYIYIYSNIFYLFIKIKKLKRSKILRNFSYILFS